MSDRATQCYRERFHKVCEFIDAHLDEKLSLERLAEIAAFSKYHFQRQFSALFGISAHRYIHLCRLKRAAYMLAYRFDIPVTEVALNCAYEALEPFSRAFRKLTGQSPSEFRAQPAWDQWYDNNWPLQTIRSQPGMSQKYNGQVRVLDFPATAVAVLEHRGDPISLGNTVRDFIGWRKQNGLPPHKSATFNIVYDDPAQVAPADYRLDLCAATDREFGDNALDIVKKTIPAGRCAVLRHRGPDEGLANAVRYLYLEWLPQSGEELRDFPLYFQRVKFFPDVAEAEAITDIFLPLK